MGLSSTLQLWWWFTLMRQLYSYRRLLPFEVFTSAHYVARRPMEMISGTKLGCDVCQVGAPCKQSSSGHEIIHCWLSLTKACNKKWQHQLDFPWLSITPLCLPGTPWSSGERWFLPIFFFPPRGIMGHALLLKCTWVFELLLFLREVVGGFTTLCRL